MDKNAIKKYAIWARRELIARVSQKALQYGILEGQDADLNADIVNGKVLSDDEKKQRKALISKIKEKGYQQVMEEVAYTWFNRFCALRFMEVNNYLPSHIRVFTNEQNEFKPQIIDEAIHLELDGLNIEKVYAYKEANDNDNLYKYLIITQCNALNKILSGMFQNISDYTELLFPDNILRDGSVIHQMIELIPEEDWQDAVQIIGWLYQFYNTEPKADVFAKKSCKISKDEIPAATQLFTPDWIVRYMVENSLGRLYYEGRKGWLVDSPDINRKEALKANWKYYIDEAEQTPEVQKQLEELWEEKYLELEDIKVIDPCMGSGHILVYAFDILMQIYESEGYSQRDAVASIVRNNIYGLDIDDRAAQLAYFAVMMKARQYDRRFLDREIEPNIYAICESNNIDKYAVEEFIGGNEEIASAINTVLSEMYDAKEYGSILNITPVDFELLYNRFDEIFDDITIYRNEILGTLLPLIRVAEVLAQKYDAVITNPPYMGISNATPKLNDYIKFKYPDSKTDFFAVFIERCYQMAKQNRYTAMITMHSWMFLSSFEKLREKMMRTDIINMAHLGARAFEEIGGEVVQTTTWIQRKTSVDDYKATYKRLVDFNSQQAKEDAFLNEQGINKYASKENFSKIPGSPIAYWVSEKFIKNFSRDNLGKYGNAKQGLITGDNDRFLRLWHEINYHLFSEKWFPYNKGGEFRRWFGNNEYVVNWENDGFEICNFKDENGKLRSRPQNLQYFFLENISWTKVTMGKFSTRYIPNGFIFSDAGSSYFLTDKKNLLYILAFTNGKVAQAYLTSTNPTMNYGVGQVCCLPMIICRTALSEINDLVRSNINVSKEDWDSFETSWDFAKHPLLIYGYQNEYGLVDTEKISESNILYYDAEKHVFEKEKGESKHPKCCLIANCFNAWNGHCDDRFNQMKANEEELNRIFIDIYGLQDELTPEVEDKDVTVRKADLQREIKSLISYAVGCMLGRYSLDVEGLAYAGGNWNEKYITTTVNNLKGTFTLPMAFSERKITHIRADGEDIPLSYAPDMDNILPICDDEYFEDDIVGKFVNFIKVVYGEETLEENLKFIADALGGKGTPKEVIRNYFLNDFYADHCRIYQKRPIYWLFDSGKKNGFKALIYMHRYHEDTLARMRTDYVHEQQARYRTAIEDLEQRVNAAETSERVKLNKTLVKIKEQSEEICLYEEKIHHLADQMIRIDLDDGVKRNYELFKDVLAKIK